MTTTCPRCSYDLSAIPPTWTLQCPMEGTCSECGLEFAWGDLLNPQLMAESRFFEHAVHKRLRAFWCTLLRLFTPVQFWQWVRLEAPIGARRMVLFSLLAIVLVHAAGSILGIAMTGGLFLATGSTPWFTDVGFWIEQSAAALLIAPFSYEGWDGFRIDPVACVGLVSFALHSLAFAALPETRRRFRVRSIHIARVAAYGCPLLPLLLQGPVLAWLGVSAGAGITIARVHIGWTQLLAITAWQVIWWRAAVRDYLRLPRPGWIAAVTALIGFLAALLLLLTVDGGWIYSGLMGLDRY